MATFKATILKKDVKEGDGPTKAYNIKIRVTHERKTAYISSEHYVTRKQLTKSLELKDEYYIKEFNNRIVGYREKLLKLSGKIHLYSAKELAEWLTVAQRPEDIDFYKFSQSYIDQVRLKRTGTAENLQTALWSIRDFFKSPIIPIDKINSRNLEKFEAYLRGDRKMVRINSLGNEVTSNKGPLTDSGIANYMTGIRTLFNAAKNEYNDEDKGEIIISHYPFKKYTMPKPAPTRKRNLQAAPIILIRDCEVSARAELARDCFMLSFYLVGINSVDLYNVDKFEDGRISYNRTKTKRKAGEAFISIKVEPEALPLLEKYRDKTGERVFDFHLRYKSADSFNKGINVGLKAVAEKLELSKFTYYYARHSWATIARNKCRISTDDIALALTHSTEHKITDVYIEKDFSIIDEANRKVLDTLINR